MKPLLRPTTFICTVALFAFSGPGLLAQAAKEPKPATDFTKQVNAEWLKRLDFANTADFEDARAGFIEGLPDGGIVKDASGKVVWDPTQYGFIVDPLVTQETAAAALKLYRKHAGDKPVTGVIYTHSHVDHFGGVRGVLSEEEIKAGKSVVVAPEHFTEEAISENVMAGNAMGRRASYMYGNVVPRGPKGTLGAGLGITTSSGLVTLLKPTHIIKETGQKLTIDGLDFEFLMAPSSEAPSEFHFYIPELKALCTGENACHTLHNFYTLRGAKTRDSKKWVGYLNQTLDLWGQQVEVLFAPHHWSITGNERIVDHIKKYRDTFKYIHDQSLRLANKGHTMIEIGEMIQLPPELDRNWPSRGYYGTVNHNAKAVYNFYLGYFNGNPSTLNEYPPAEAAKRYVDFMGGADAVLEKAKTTFDKGDYRWTAQVVSHVVLADPKNEKARYFLADTLEQLGYQSEGAVWRNFYLAGAKELRDGVQQVGVPSPTSPDMVTGMSMELLFDYMAIQINPEKIAGKKLTVKMELPDIKESYLLTLENSVLNYFPGKPDQKADTTLTINRSDLNAILLGQIKLPGLVAEGKAKLEGKEGVLADFLGALEPFEFWFNIVTANPAK